MALEVGRRNRHPQEMRGFLTDYSDHFVVGGLKFHACAVDSNWSPRTFRSLGVGLVRQTRRIYISDDKDQEGRSVPGAAISYVCSALIEKRDDIGLTFWQVAARNDKSMLRLMHISGNAVTVHEYLRMRIAPEPRCVTLRRRIDDRQGEKSDNPN